MEGRENGDRFPELFGLIEEYADGSGEKDFCLRLRPRGEGLQTSLPTTNTMTGPMYPSGDGSGAIVEA